MKTPTLTYIKIIQSVKAVMKRMKNSSCALMLHRKRRDSPNGHTWESQRCHGPICWLPVPLCLVEPMSWKASDSLDIWTCIWCLCPHSADCRHLMLYLPPFALWISINRPFFRSTREDLWPLEETVWFSWIYSSYTLMDLSREKFVWSEWNYILKCLFHRLYRYPSDESLRATKTASLIHSIQWWCFHVPWELLPALTLGFEGFVKEDLIATRRTCTRFCKWVF